MQRFNVVQRGERNFELLDRQTGQTVKSDLYEWEAHDVAELLNDDLPAWADRYGVTET